jgi:hypothetical protein
MTEMPRIPASVSIWTHLFPATGATKKEPRMLPDGVVEERIQRVCRFNIDEAVKFLSFGHVKA